MNNSGWERWCILTTSGGRTLPLMDALKEAGFRAWTPREIVKRPIPGSRPDKHGRRPLMEVGLPILPTYVFAPASDIDALFRLSLDPISRLPSFSMFRHGGRIPEIAGSSIVGLQAAEHAAEAAITAIRDAETHQKALEIRAAAMKTERDRRKMLRRQLRDFRAGQEVMVAGEASFAGLTGKVESSNGREAVVLFGSMPFTIEAWKLMPKAV